MIPMMRTSFIGQSLQLLAVTRKITTESTKCIGTVVAWRTPTSCSCGAAQREDRPNGMRKLIRLLRSSSTYYEIPNLSQWHSISTSCAVAVTAAAGTVQHGGPIAAENGAQWDLFAGIVLERKPIITANKNELQEKYAKYLEELEFEISKKSDHEVRNDKDLKMLEKVKSGDIDLGNVQTAKDDEDRWNTEAQSFQPACRETEADKKNDIRSLNRALDSHLLLVVEQKLGNDYRWVCPHSKLEQGETLRQAAERMLRAQFPDIKAKILGHAPWGFYKYRYPRDTSNETTTGAKVFFYKAQVVSGESNKKDGNDVIKDFVWLKRDELLNKLQPEYYRKLSDCLIEE